MNAKRTWMISNWFLLLGHERKTDQTTIQHSNNDNKWPPKEHEWFQNDSCYWVTNVKSRRKFDFDKLDCGCDIIWGKLWRFNFKMADFKISFYDFIIWSDLWLWKLTYLTADKSLWRICFFYCILVFVNMATSLKWWKTSDLKT